MDVATFWTLAFVYWLVFGGFCAFIGSQKGRSTLGWFISGVLFGFLALIAVIAVPRLDRGDDE